MLRPPPDTEILAWAHQHALVLITNDLDFSAILAAGAVDGPSMVQIRTQDLLSDGAVSVIAKALEAPGGNRATCAPID